MRFFLSLIFVLALASAGVGYDWLNRPMEMPSGGVDLSIEPGSSAKDVAASVAQAGVRVQPVLLYGWFRVSGQSRQIKAGSYELDGQTTPRSLLQQTGAGR